MTVRVHIERLVLDGLPIDKGHGPGIAAAVEAELGRLIAERGDASGLSFDGGERLQGTPLVWNRGGGGDLGVQIANSVFGSLMR